MANNLDTPTLADLNEAMRLWNCAKSELAKADAEVANWQKQLNSATVLQKKAADKVDELEQKVWKLVKAVR